MYVNDGVYVGKVEAQSLAEKNGQPKLYLSVKLTDECVNRYNPNDGKVALPAPFNGTRMVVIDLNPVANKYAENLGTLSYYGMVGDVLTLHSRHPDYFTLTGKTVYLRCWLKETPDGKPDPVFFLVAPRARALPKEIDFDLLANIAGSGPEVGVGEEDTPF